ncbi:MAG: CBS domain-containing protein [Candidatus Nitrosotalea sp.]|nr:CBS domain-containing protein [Candidatus Nitrosotalea sp.]
MALETHHVDISHRTLGIADYIITEDLPKIVSNPDSVTIASIMTRNVVSIDHTKTAHDAAEIMLEKKIGSVIITAYGKPFGIVTERDLARIMAIIDIPSNCLILSFLASRPLVCVNTTCTIQEAASIMAQYNIDHLPVLENNKIVGMVTTHDLAMYLLYA